MLRVSHVIAYGSKITDANFKRLYCHDNLKSAVLNGAGRYACFHPEFLALCGHFCMEPIACAARDPESKGIVEGGVPC